MPISIPVPCTKHLTLDLIALLKHTQVHRLVHMSSLPPHSAASSSMMLLEHSTFVLRVGRPDDKDVKERIISIVRNGADGTHYQALIQQTCAWLKEQTPEEVSDLVPRIDHR